MVREGQFEFIFRADHDRFVVAHRRLEAGPTAETRKQVIVGANMSQEANRYPRQEEADEIHVL